MRRRIAGFRSSVGRSNCFTSTLPLGNCHAPVSAKVICSAAVSATPLFGKASQRCFDAPSVQSGEFTVKGINPLRGVRVAKLLNAPTWESVAGGWAPPGIPGVVDGSLLSRYFPIGVNVSNPYCWAGAEWIKAHSPMARRVACLESLIIAENRCIPEKFIKIITIH